MRPSGGSSLRRRPVQSLCRCLMRSLHRDGESAAESLRKQLVLLCTMCVVIVGGLAVVRRVGHGIACFEAGIFIGVLGNVGSFTYGVVTRRMPRRAVEGGMTVAVVGCLMADWGNAAVPGQIRLWSVVILAMDVLLTVNARRSSQAVCLGLTAVWLVLSATEDGFRLGLYDVEGWTKAHPDDVERATNCGAPPCAQGFSHTVTISGLYLATLIIDFAATRGFADGQRREKDRVLRMVAVAEQVAQCLVRFDLDAAKAALGDGRSPGMTDELTVSFRSLLANLASYKPYLPDSCFARDDDTGDGSGSGSGSAGASMSTAKGAPSGEQGSDVSNSFARSRQQSTGSPRRWSAATGDSTSVASSFAGHPAAVPQAKVGHPPQVRRVTLLATNRKGFLTALQLPIAELAAWVAVEVERFQAEVQCRKGVVDQLCADHLGASFWGPTACRRWCVHSTTRGRRPRALRGAVRGTGRAAPRCQ
eukprot:TRINITY_DN17684_c0_g5_i1.p1 TRINITY_DN17684_c0_g5~~TRINITY_DN17684_c0_g5_i1.p1  ORF type:complete len:499 (+),score=114.24 TRINITY_DN17684_c0_g5_i1:72-1499(+)